MTLILLHTPVASTPTDSPRRFERVHMFAGRHLGEEEFDLEQAYADLRLASLLRGRGAGIVHGLEVNMGPNGVGADGFNVNPGLALDGHGRAVTLYFPLRAQWQALIESWRSEHDADDPTGVYYLVLRRARREIDSPTVDPCQRMELDPTRDTRLVVAGTLALQRLNVAAQSVTAARREQIENWVAADRVDASFLKTLGSAVPLALLAIGPVEDDFGPHWLSQEAGRYEAAPNGGYRVLLNQTSAAMRRVMQRAAAEVSEGESLADFLANELRLDFLPAAGQLPLEWLQNPAAVAPNLLWLPNHLGVDMVPVPEEAVLGLIRQHIARRVIDLRQPSGDKVRLLLAVNEPDYRADLLDIPQTEARLEQDLFRFYMRAYDAWRKWHEQFDRLYHMLPSHEAPAPDPEVAALESAVLDLSQFKHLDLPRPELPPVLANSFLGAMIARASAELGDGTSDPYPFSKGPPAPPVFFTQWLSGGNPPPVPTPTADGLVVQYAIALVELEAIENQVRGYRTRLEKTRDLLLLMRQQLDSQTVALAALAGGVAGDGTGLQVARWLPYASLDAAAASEVETSAPRAQLAAAAVAASPIPTPMLAKSAQNMLAPAPKAITSSGLSMNLIQTALTSTSTVSKSNLLLASKPQSFSAFELGINKTRLDRLAGIAKNPVTKPAFEAKEYRFSVIDHISPEVNEYAKAYYSMKELIATLKSLFDASDAASLRRDLSKAGVVEEKEEPAKDPNPFERSSRLEAPSVLDNLATEQAGTDVNAAKRRVLLLNQYRYHGLFKAGRILTQWIATCETRYGHLERKLQAKLREQAEKLAWIDKLAALIRVARETLESLDRFRVEQLGDYGVAQRLLEEDWRRVHAVDRERSRVLTSALRGLYYVRVRNTPVSAALSAPLPLRFGSGRDIVPGCDWEEEVDLPAALEPFFQTVCEIPMADWARLRPLQPKLPPFEHFDFLGQVRQARFKARGTTPAAATGLVETRLQTVQLQNRSVLQQWSALTLPAFTLSSLKTQAEAARVLSLEDLALASGALRNEGQALKEQLEHAAYCVLQKLNLLPGSVRLQWGQLAEDDRINVEEVARWPGLERVEAEDFNTIRTLAELVSWCFRQLDREAGAASRSALRNLIRALLIHASLGDPNEIVRGSVHVPPRQTRVGERLQVLLNRAPRPGTRLQLLDPQQQVAAVLVVEDHTPEGTRVSIVDLVQPEIRISTRFSVVANKQTRLKL